MYEPFYWNKVKNKHWKSTQKSNFQVSNLKKKNTPTTAFNVFERNGRTNTPIRYMILLLHSMDSQRAKNCIIHLQIYNRINRKKKKKKIETHTLLDIEVLEMFIVLLIKCNITKYMHEYTKCKQCHK